MTAELGKDITTGGLKKDVFRATLDLGDVLSLVEDGNKIALLASMSALNRAARKARTRIVRDVATTTRTPQKLVGLRSRVRSARKGKLLASVTLLKLGVPLIRFPGVKWDATRSTSTKGKTKGRRLMSLSGKGVSAPGGHRYPQGFIAKSSRNGLRHVFQRRGTTRLPIDAVRIQVATETTLAQMDARMQEAAAWAADNLEKEITWRLGRRIGGLSGLPEEGK